MKRHDNFHKDSTDTLWHYKKELLIISIILCWSYIACAIFSYNPTDPTLFSYISNHYIITNWAGKVGAYLAAFSLYLFGLCMYLLPIVLGFFCYIMCCTKKNTTNSSSYLLGSLLFIMLCAVCSNYNFVYLHAMRGGLVGNWIYHFLQIYLGSFYCHLLLWGSLVILCIMLFKIPIIFYTINIIHTCTKKLLSIYLLTTITIKAKIIRLLKRKSTPVIIKPACTDLEKAITYAYNTVKNNPDIILQSKAIHDNTPHFFSTIALRLTCSYRPFLKWSILILPNTVLSNSLFAQKSSNRPLYLHIEDAILEKNKDFSLPNASLFKINGHSLMTDTIMDQVTKRATMVEEKLRHFGLHGSITAIKPGPVVTMFEYLPDIDNKISKIIALEDDLAMALSAKSMRIIAPIPGKNVIGFEISNDERETILFGTIVANKLFEDTSANLPLALGVDVTGSPIIVDMIKMPHLLVGGATGAGKSVALNTMLLSLLCKVTPKQLKLILIDPKRLEFAPYAHIPHLLFPIVTQASRAVAVLQWVVQEMEQRYETMASFGVRNISEYNNVLKKIQKNSATTSIDDSIKDPEPLPFIVVVIDELADLMIVAGKEIETQIVRLAQMARAAGIHLIIATQRPSVDVVTGLIKANFPSRIAFRVSSRIDSRTILDVQGAEKLLGSGDMLFMHSSSPEINRVHGAYVSDSEVEIIASFLRSQATPAYVTLQETPTSTIDQSVMDVDNELYTTICTFVQTMEEISISMIQRQYRIGFNRSARLIDRLERDGIVAPSQGGKPRKVLRMQS